MADWDTTDFKPNADVIAADRRALVDMTSDSGTQSFDNPAYREDTTTFPMHAYRKHRNGQPDQHANHLIYDVSRNRPTTINKGKRYRTSSGSSGTLVIKKNTDEYGTNRHSEPLVLNARYLDKQATLRKHHTMSRSTANVFYTKSRKYYQKLHTTGVKSGSHRHGLDRKASCISLFDIETDKVDSYQYRPGEEVCGVLNLIVNANVEIRYVELQVVGEGVLTLQNIKAGLPRTVKEVYLKKSTCVIGSADSSWTSLLTPGHYTSKFRVKLPPGLPSSLYHQDTNNGFTYEVKYTLKARVCDNVITTSSMRGSFRQGLTKAILTKKVRVNVQRSFDLNTISGAMVPITKTERLDLSCSHRKPAIVSLILERSVFLAGDDIRLQLSATLPGSLRMKEIDCTLQEHLTFGSKHERLTFSIAKANLKEPQSSSDNGDNLIEVAIPTRTDLISSFGVGQSPTKVSYSLDVSLTLKPAGGKLLFKIPIRLGPCAEPIYGEKTSTKKIIPVFNRPTRFPMFSPTPQTNGHASGTPRETHAEGSAPPPVPVASKYSNGCLARCFLCCWGLGDAED